MRQAAHLLADATGRKLVRPLAPLREPGTALEITLDHLIALRLLRLQTTDLFFVQIGAFDGRTGDQLYEYATRYGWHGILVEPQPQPFAELGRTYGGRDGITLYNYAVTERRETRTLYTVNANSGSDPIAHQAASFSRDHVTTHVALAGGTPDAITETRVECISFAELLSGIAVVDILQIDVEGYDAELIRMFDFDLYKPGIVRFEHRHLSRSDHEAAVAKLVSYGYRVATPNLDTLAWLDSPAP